MTLRLFELGPDPDAPFPPVQAALRDPDGLLAFGGDLHPRRLVAAYRQGIFPWYSPGEPILWWSPDPRCVFDTPGFRLPRRARRELRGRGWSVRVDTAFEAVVSACAGIPRRGQRGTWITTDMMAAYTRLHQLGHAHSVEVYARSRLVGGLYGVQAGAVFCGESMFSHETGGSKLALWALCRLLHAHGAHLLDAQVPNPHLESLGARPMARAEYLHWLERPAPPALPLARWTTLAEGLDPAELA